MHKRILLLFYLFFIIPHTTLAAELTNPLYTTDIRDVIGRIIQAVLGVTGAVALLMFVYGGFLWLISGGETEKVKKGKDTMKWAILGLAVIIGAYMIVSTIINALEKGTVA
ncbi:TrbC/VirB2 family protein [Candidatus Uhrbacteria bacterium]|nr:TrbC/VirB2 family protein [Candidatus Uhrbacteria bacterium]